MLLLARHFLAQYARQYRKALEGFTPEAERLLQSHSWPGNVRELRAAISSAAVLGEGGLIGPELLGQVERNSLLSLNELPRTPDHIMTIEELELRYVARVLRLCGGNKVLAAQRLGISRQTLGTLAGGARRSRRRRGARTGTEEGRVNATQAGRARG